MIVLNGNDEQLELFPRCLTNGARWREDDNALPRRGGNYLYIFLYMAIARWMQRNQNSPLRRHTTYIAVYKTVFPALINTKRRRVNDKRATRGFPIGRRAKSWGVAAGKCDFSNVRFYAGVSVTHANVYDLFRPFWRCTQRTRRRPLFVITLSAALRF